MSEAERRFLMRTEWGFVHQNPADGLRMTVSPAPMSASAVAVGDRHYGKIRATAVDWLSRVEIAEDRIDDEPALLRRHAPAASDRAQSGDWASSSSSWTSRPAD